MATLTAEQIAQAAYGGGWRNARDVAIATAIGMAESGGNPRAHNKVPPDNSYGIWQINMLGAMGPARRKQFGITNNDQLFDPNVNAKAAYMVWQSQGWRAWSVYKNGRYQRHMGEATAAAQKVVISGGSVPGGTIEATPVALVNTGPIEAVVDLVKFLVKPTNWLRMSAFAVGALLLLLGLDDLIGIPNPVSGIAKQALKTTTGGMVG